MQEKILQVFINLCAYDAYELSMLLCLDKHIDIHGMAFASQSQEHVWSQCEI